MRDFFWFFMLSAAMYFVESYFEQGTTANFSAHHASHEDRSLAAESEDDAVDATDTNESLPQNRVFLSYPIR